MVKNVRYMKEKEFILSAEDKCLIKKILQKDKINTRLIKRVNRTNSHEPEIETDTKNELKTLTIDEKDEISFLLNNKEKIIEDLEVKIHKNQTESSLNTIDETQISREESPKYIESDDNTENSTNSEMAPKKQNDKANQDGKISSDNNNKPKAKSTEYLMSVIQDQRQLIEAFSTRLKALEGNDNNDDKQSIESQSQDEWIAKRC